MIHPASKRRNTSTTIRHTSYIYRDAHNIAHIIIIANIGDRYFGTEKYMIVTMIVSAITSPKRISLSSDESILFWRSQSKKCACVSTPSIIVPVTGEMIAS